MTLGNAKAQALAVISTVSLLVVHNLAHAYPNGYGDIVTAATGELGLVNISIGLFTYVGTLITLWAWEMDSSSASGERVEVID